MAHEETSLSVIRRTRAARPVGHETQLVVQCVAGVDVCAVVVEVVRVTA